MSYLSSTFAEQCQELLYIMTNPSSYKENSTSITKPTTNQEPMNDLLNILNSMRTTSNKDEILQYVIDSLKKILPDELKIDYSDFNDYFKKVESYQSNPVCDCFVKQIEQLENYSDDDVVKSSDLFMSFHCKTCGHYDSSHKVCNRFAKNENYDCDTCGLGKSVHKICGKYVGITDDCNSCGYSWYEHCDDLDEKMIHDCGNFTEHPENSSRCANCIFNETHHQYTHKFHSLNPKSKAHVSDLFFKITADFICMSEIERVCHYNIYSTLTTLLTNSF